MRRGRSRTVSVAQTCFAFDVVDTAPAAVPAWSVELPTPTTFGSLPAIQVSSRPSELPAPPAPFDSAAREAGRLAQDGLPALAFQRHRRAKRYILRVADDGTVRVTMPRWGSKREAMAFAARQQAWIEKQRRRLENERRQRLDRGECERLEDAGEHVRSLRDQARRELPARLMELAAAHGLTVARVSIRNQRSRWGSCSRSGHICLNWRLITMPPSVRDYVLIHELMHLKRFDHSPRFWKLVAAACPDYRAQRAWLRTQRS